MAHLVVYEKRTCTTCRRLAERSVDFECGDRAVLARPVERVPELL